MLHATMGHDTEIDVRVERASLRHVDAFVEAARASRRLHKNWVTPPATSDAFRAYVRAKRNTAHASYFLFDPASDALVGVININEIVRGLFQSAYLGYYAFAPHHGHGYMSLGLNRVIQLAFRGHGLHRLEANIQPGNGASIALVKRAGFRREGCSIRYLKIAGRWRDHERWALTVEEWKATRRPRATQSALALAQS
ncbi:MAG TPA: GNAT family protein [Polyangiales bacterium]|jgi:ribosomal-protein-alanine N-acetyltransferase|nr:GNAT family protein [Polyangiales bacterium]